MPKDTAPSENARIAAAALRLAAAKGWPQVTLDAVAKAARIPVAKLRQRFSASHQFAPIIAEAIDREAFAAAGKTTGTPHDVLFDLLMARFDILQKHRKAIVSMADTARHDRSLSCALTRATIDGIYRLIETSHLTAPPRPVLALGLIPIYGWAFWVWRQDTSRDMGKTMAALDRGLKWAGKAAAPAVNNNH